MKTINELRDELLQLFTDVKEGATDVKVAGEMNNTAGKIINSVKAELEYAALRKVDPVIPFLDYAKK
jgi:hypothetical protein